MKRIFLLVAALMSSLACGCSAPKPPFMQPTPELPKTALPANEGIGRLFFQSTEDGVIYVLDDDTADVIMNVPIKKNQRFVLDPQNSLATIEGKKVFEAEINKKHTHRIYLDPHGKPPATEKKP